MKEKERDRKYAYPVTHSESGWTSQIQGQLLARQYAPYRGYSLIRNRAPPGPYSWTISGAICWPRGSGVTSEVHP